MGRRTHVSNASIPPCVSEKRNMVPRKRARNDRKDHGSADAKHGQDDMALRSTAGVLEASKEGEAAGEDASTTGGTTADGGTEESARSSSGKPSLAPRSRHRGVSKRW
jgi:hypothetical protein